MDDPPAYSASQEGQPSNSQRPSATASAPMMAVSAAPVMQPVGGHGFGFRGALNNPCRCMASCCPGRSLEMGSVAVGVLSIVNDCILIFVESRKLKPMVQLYAAIWGLIGTWLGFYTGQGGSGYRRHAVRAGRDSTQQ